MRSLTWNATTAVEPEERKVRNHVNFPMAKVPKDVAGRTFPRGTPSQLADHADTLLRRAGESGRYATFVHVDNRVEGRW